MGKCKLRTQWLERTDNQNVKVSLWGNKISETTLYCYVCMCPIDVENKGFQAIFSHSETLKHKTNFQQKLGPNQMHLEARTPVPAFGSGDVLTQKEPAPSATISMYNVKETATAAELLWTMKSVCSNYSTDSCQDIHQTFRAMFHSGMPEHFSLSPKKMRYIITDGLAPYFYESMLQEAQSSYYTLSFDETTNVKSNKELQITIQFWSESKNKVTTRHLKSFFIGKADGETLHKKITEAITSANLSLHKFLMLASDGPNVNKKVFNLLDKDVREIREKGLINIGTCNIHIMHNAYVKALQFLGLEASDLLVNIHNYFDGWPARCEEYEEVQTKLKLPHKKFIKHSTTRWLSMSPAAENMIQQWEGIRYYFLEHVPKTKVSAILQNRSYNTIVSALKQPCMKAELHFIVSSANMFTKFTKSFQSQEPMIHRLHSDTISIFKTCMCRVLKTAAVKRISCLPEFHEDEVFSPDNLLPFREIVVSGEVQKELVKLTEKDKLVFLTQAQKHYLAACKHMLAKTCLSTGSVKRFRFLHPDERKKTRSCQDIVSVAKSMPFDIAEDELLDEWKILQLEKDDIFITNEENARTDCEERVKHMKKICIDDYWHQHISKKDSSGNLKFPNVTKVVKAALTLSHGNADIERRFSVSGLFLTNDKTAMTERFLNAALTVKDALKQYDDKVFLVPMTKTLITYGQQAHKKYISYMEKRQRELKVSEEDRKRKEEREKALEEEYKQMERTKKSLEVETLKLKGKEKEYHQTKEAREQLLLEASTRLKKALQKNDLKGAKLAQGMLDGVCLMQEEESFKAKEVETIQKSIEKRKSAVITSYFTKKPKNN